MEKLSKLKSASYKANGQQLINLKIQQLALNRLLVLNYGRHEFRLVLAHGQLGEAYLAFDCFEQALQHLSLALNKNNHVIEQIPKAKLLQVNLQLYLADSYSHMGSYDQAIEQLQHALELQRQYNEQLPREQGQRRRNLKIIVLKSQCLAKQKNYSQALSTIQQVINITQSRRGNKPEQAFALVDKAAILAEINNNQKLNLAIQNLQQAINLLVEDNYHRPQQVAELYLTLGDYHEKIGNADSALTCIQKVKTLYQDIYGLEDKRVLKTRRKIATALLRSQRFKQAVAQLLQISKLEQKLLGQNIQLARTLKLLGTVYSSLNIGDGRVYLKRSMNIFQNCGQRKQVEEIKKKIRAINTEQNNQEGILISQQDI